MPFTTATLERALDNEVGEWTRRGYRVVSRSPTTAQMVKPGGSVMPAAIVWLLLCGLVLGLWLTGIFGTPDFGSATLIVLAVCSVGLLILVIAQLSRGEASVFLRIGEDGGIVQN